jgi:hypothetical protein
MFCAGRNPRQFRPLMFVRSSVTLLWAVPPVDAGCLWLVTLSKGMARPFCFVLERVYFTITPTQYQSGFEVQALFSKIFSAYSYPLSACSPSDRRRLWRRHNRRAEIQPRRLCACSLLKCPNPLPRLCRAILATPAPVDPSQTPGRATVSPSPPGTRQSRCQSAGRGLERAFRRSPVC